jgi:transcription elongation factor GreB
MKQPGCDRLPPVITSLRMSKAFTRESDGSPDVTAVPRPVTSLPPGAKNYLTAAGERKLRDELSRLARTERPALALRAANDDPDFKRQLRALDQRISQLELSLQSAVVVPPPSDAQDVVKFGATVTVREQNGEVSRYRIVGADEADVDLGWVSWVSPVARALLNARVGDSVRLDLPVGVEELVILKVCYEDDSSPQIAGNP